MSDLPPTPFCKTIIQTAANENFLLASEIGLANSHRASEQKS